MSIAVVNRRRSFDRIRSQYPRAQIIDVTSRGPDPWVSFSPFYPHGGIPVPGFPELEAQSVEGVWQALKVFDGEDIDTSRLKVTTMRGLKRTVRRLGPVRGHRYGLHGRLLPYREARHEIYLPTYRWVLENRLAELVNHLRSMEDIVLLDYTINDDPDDVSSPLSHAALLRRWLLNDWPATRPATTHHEQDPAT